MPRGVSEAVAHDEAAAYSAAMRFQHILGAALIATLAFPAFATDLYVSQVRGCGLIIFCSPSLRFTRIDLERNEVTLLPETLPGYTSVAGFDAARPRVFVSTPTSDIFCCRAMWLDLTANPPVPPYGLYPFAGFSSYVFDSGRLFAIRGADLVELDVVTGAATPVMPINLLAEPLAIDLAHQRLYLSVRPDNSQARDLRVVDLARKTISGPLMSIRQLPAVVVDRDGTAYVFDGLWQLGLTQVFRLDAATNELTPFASDVLIGTQHLVLDPVDRRVYGNYDRDVVAFDLVTRTTRVIEPPLPPGTFEWGPVAGVVHKSPGRTRAIR